MILRELESFTNTPLSLKYLPIFFSIAQGLSPCRFMLMRLSSCNNPRSIPFGRIVSEPIRLTVKNNSKIEKKIEGGVMLLFSKSG